MAGFLRCDFFRLAKEQIKKDIKWVYDLFPRLEERKNQLSDTLSGGEQQMLAVARALITGRELMLLDL